jgi:hypothetical protein
VGLVVFMVSSFALAGGAQVVFSII